MDSRGATGVNVDWFHRPENKHFSKDRVKVFGFEAPAGSTLEQLLAAGYAVGVPRGSHRGGVFEIQTDEGIWSSPTDSRLDPKTAVFKTWEQLEKEEQ